MASVASGGGREGRRILDEILYEVDRIDIP
jgi:hypothetical protein